jgi:hypothetical protein
MSAIDDLNAGFSASGTTGLADVFWGGGGRQTLGSALMLTQARTAEAPWNAHEYRNNAKKTSRPGANRSELEDGLSSTV